MLLHAWANNIPCCTAGRRRRIFFSDRDEQQCLFVSRAATDWALPIYVSNNSSSSSSVHSHGLLLLLLFALRTTNTVGVCVQRVHLAIDDNMIERDSARVRLSLLVFVANSHYVRTPATYTYRHTAANINFYHKYTHNGQHKRYKIVRAQPLRIVTISFIFILLYARYFFN